MPFFGILLCLLLCNTVGDALRQHGAVSFRYSRPFCTRAITGSPVAVASLLACCASRFSTNTRPWSAPRKFRRPLMPSGHGASVLHEQLHGLAALLPDTGQSSCTVRASRLCLPSPFQAFFDEHGTFVARSRLWKHAFGDPSRFCSPLRRYHIPDKGCGVGGTQPEFIFQTRRKSNRQVPAFCFQTSESVFCDRRDTDWATSGGVLKQNSFASTESQGLQPSNPEGHISPNVSSARGNRGRRDEKPRGHRGDNRLVALLRVLRIFPKGWSGGWGNRTTGATRDRTPHETDEAYREESTDHPLGAPWWRLALRRRTWLGFVDSEEEELVDVHFKEDGTAITGHGIPGTWTLTRSGVSLFLFVPRDSPSTVSGQADAANKELEDDRRGVQQGASPELSHTVFHFTAFLHWDAESGTPYMYRGSVTRDRESWLCPSFLFRPVVATFYGYGIDRLPRST
uniref:Transmembrane protein n=1 Tax=Neospora caninum (strain Liverpool) TaxID=572307 RepID=A0A0F7UEC4_NEOCL|nr:TPA: hypothetical protein BN1204_031765 [Neospora caninum Liverpool]